MHIDAQQIIALAIVAVAATALIRRLGGQIAALFGRATKSVCESCGGCALSAVKKRARETAPPRPAEPQLVQIQLKAPQRIQRPDTK